MSLAKRLGASFGLKTKKSEEPVDETLDEEPPSIIGLMDEVLVRRTHALNFFRPSMLFGCSRANYFHYVRAPFHPSRQAPRMLRILDVGSAYHEVLQKHLGDLHEWWFAPESRIYVQVEGAWIRGSCDGVLIRRSDMYRVGIELKSINHNEFLKLTKPKEGHVFQASLYAKLQGLKWIVVVYIDKNTQNLKEFPVKFNGKNWKESKERIRKLKMYVDEKRIPKFDPSTCDVTFCGSVDHCRKKGAPV